mmetsp:Transcript_8181/g.8114  ORF Transcript_8181/g.8114 Transcript_8181/m.8114 type:complete len:83 (+) Transcript_8181:412-660(+)
MSKKNHNTKGSHKENPGDTQFSFGAHADGGSLERWEDIEYRKCYEPIFQGLWEEYDTFDSTHRIGVDINLHDSVYSEHFSLF